MKKQWFNLKAQGNHLDIYLYGVIGGWDVNVDTFMEQLESVPNPETVTVFINTVGGTFNDGLPIFNTIAQLDAEVTIKVMGFALSMGAVLMLSGDKVQIAQNGVVMIHRAQTFSAGDAAQLRKDADVLEVMETGVIKLLAQRMGKTEKEVLALMQDETWFSADTALEAGLIDEIIDPIDLSKAIDEALVGKEAIDSVSNYHNMPADISALINKKTAKSNLFQSLFALGRKKPSEKQNTDTDDDMKPEEVKAIVEEAVKPLNENLSQMKQANEELVGKNTELAEKVEALSTELAELKTTIPPTPTPENDGANGDLTYDY